MARQIIVIALISLAAFAAVVSAQSPASAPSKSTAAPTVAPSKSTAAPIAAPKSAPVPFAAAPAPKAAASNATGAGIADDETDPPIPSDEPTESPADSPADSPDASDDGSSTDSSDQTLPAAGGAASLEFSAAVGATAAAGYFLM